MDAPTVEFARQTRGKLMQAPVVERVEGFTPSAVLMLFQFVGGEPHLVLTLRTTSLGRHSGEVSFPGGKVEPGVDASPLQTALRETTEEVGVPASEVEVLGFLDNFPTLTRYYITPVVGLREVEVGDTGWDLPVSKAEVARVVLAPLSFFETARPPVFRETAFDFPAGKFPIYSFQYGDLNIWGATAHLIVSFLQVTGRPCPPTSGTRRFSAKEILEKVPVHDPEFPRGKPGSRTFRESS
ncbi:MAG: NUDIX hydrolase [Promethearchaeota archaeon]